MKERFKIHENWILPVEGTFGNKARNLYGNQRIITEQGFKIPRSMVIPYEYLTFGYPAIVDAIYHFFNGCRTVAVRSNAPDEDLGERTPGMYRSEEIDLDGDIDGTDGTNDLIRAIVESYHYYDADFRRKELGLEDKGMCLLVQEFIPASYSGSFSDLGEIGILAFTDPRNGMHAMTERPFAKYRVDLEGKIISKSLMHTNTYEEYVAGRLRRLSSALPRLDNDRGWELEFVLNEGGNYIVQTTPIRKQAAFEVIPSDKNIFDAREVIGCGNFRTNGILYLPFFEQKILDRFDERNSDYCLVTSYHTISKGSDKDLSRVRNSRVLICIEDMFPGLHPFSAHVAQFVRQEDRCAILGRFTNDLDKYLLSSEGISQLHSKGQPAHSLFSQTQLDIQVDESLNRTNIEIIEEAKPFKNID